MLNRSSPTPDLKLPHSTYRPDVDGLRAVSIILVLLYHANALKSGFIGVDIFFIISGFVITQIILKDLALDRFSFAQFYLRRVRRIFPALLAVLVSTLIIGGLILLPSEYIHFGKSLVWSSFFLNNFNLILDTGYFAGNAKLKPLLHLWSLAVEWQFYLLYPILLYVCRCNLKMMFYAVIVTMVLSFASNLAFLSTYPREVFLSLPTRFWMLEMGGLVAILLHARASLLPAFLPIVTPPHHRLKRIYKNLLNLLGLSCLILGVVFLHDKIPYPGAAGLLPALGASLLILSGSNTWSNKVLANRYVVFLGLISYPLYLWHWPIISMIRVIGDGILVPLHAAIGLAVSFVLATATYFFIEKPIRKKRNLRIIGLWLIAGMLVLAGVGLIISKDGLKNRFSAQISEEFIVPDMIWRSDCRSFIPTGLASEFCLLNLADQKKPSVAIIGDSLSNRLFLGVERAREAISAINLGEGGCLPFINVSGYSNEEDRDIKCQPAMNAVINFVKEDPDIKTIVLAGSFIKYFDGTITPMITDNKSDIVRQIETTLTAFLTANKNVVVVLDTYKAPLDIRKCKFRPFRLSHDDKEAVCTFPVPTSRASFDHRAFFYDLSRKYKNLRIVDPNPLFCQNGFCDAWVDGIAIYDDSIHLTIDGAKSLAKILPLD